MDIFLKNLTFFLQTFYTIETMLIEIKNACESFIRKISNAEVEALWGLIVKVEEMDRVVGMSPQSSF